MTAGELEAYLHRHIPLSKAMGVAVIEASGSAVTLAAPLAPNINHRETVFGGSASAVALLAAWSLLYLGLQQERLEGRLVVQRNAISYERPMTGDFTATAVREDEAAWARFAVTLRRRGRARLSVGATLACNGERAGRLEGEFAALAPAARGNQT